MKPKLQLFLFAALFAIPGSASSTSIDLFVSPRGRDNWSGKLQKPNAQQTDGPLASLDGARLAARRLRSTRRIIDEIHVRFAPGVYYITHPVVFGPEDGSTGATSTRYQPLMSSTNATALDNHVIFDGGVTVKRFRVQPDGTWIASLPREQIKFDQVYVNGRRAIPARWPSKNWFHMTGKYTPHPNRPIQNAGGRAFCVTPEVFGKLRALSPEELANVTVVVYHSWEISQHHIESLDDSQHGIILKGAGAPWAFMEWGATQRFHVENMPVNPRELGTFCIRPGTVQYVPLKGEKPKTATAKIPQTEQFIVIQGTPQLKVEGLVFEHLSFRNAGYHLPDEGHGDGQAAASIEAVIQVDNAKNVVFTDCEITHTGLYGLWFRQGCQDCRLDRSYLHDLGAGGVRIGEMSIRPPGPDRTREISVSNNIVHSTGRIFMGSIGIWIGQSGDNIISHNDISDTFYTGISDGWTWGYSEALAQRNHIDFNHIHHLGQGVLSDLGGVYTLGDHRGGTVNNNVIHNVYSYDRYGRGGWGLYNDEGTTGIVMENNLVYNTKTGSYHQHYGRDNIIRNNILVNSMDGQVQRSRVEGHLSFTLSHNIISWNDGELQSGSWNDNNVKLDNNLYWNASGKPIKFGGLDFEAWQKSGKDNGSRIADPLFVNSLLYDFRLRRESPAISMGFKPFNAAESGVTGLPKWKRLPSTFLYQKVDFVE